MCGTFGISLLIFAVTAIPKQVCGYCWAAGRNPSFTDVPKVEQLKINLVRVSWHDIVAQRDCADNFVVKYWPKDAPNAYEITDLIPTDEDQVDIEVIPKIFYNYQAVAREDKGVIGGVEWNKSPVVEFRTRNHGNLIRNSHAESSAEFYDADSVSPYEEKRLQVMGMGIEVFIGIVVAILIALFIMIGVTYKVISSGKSKSVGEEDEDDDDDDDIEKNEEFSDEEVSDQEEVRSLKD